MKHPPDELNPKSSVKISIEHESKHKFISATEQQFKYFCNITI